MAIRELSDVFAKLRELLPQFVKLLFQLFHLLFKVLLIELNIGNRKDTCTRRVERATVAAATVHLGQLGRNGLTLPLADDIDFDVSAFVEFTQRPKRALQQPAYGGCGRPAP